MPKISLKQQVEQQISRTKQDVFLRADFEQLGGYDQVGRALRELVAEGKLLKIGYGLYAKARISSITGKPMLASTGGFKAVSEQALERLGVAWQPSDELVRYNKGETTQVPVNAKVIVKSRFNRKISLRNMQLQVEQRS
ncbi:MAG: conjugal transfer protein [Gammaproteobacteria bacterium]|nr:conjugal transfer protein [Gammaproteobacteria bacterium]MBU1556847.1 conjugal transfer protein [Gammaproteobacteria bacterium]MBU2071061.1 conjugal transfer protein [Gammaproteobacteria bacterium]MBU2184329.1 conjugal transfer protein [Gammaproteobacteria bacterium]MBU2206414.1 conjugal transfer protein [Gammaproteobacteria bacterium]